MIMAIAKSKNLLNSAVVPVIVAVTTASLFNTIGCGIEHEDTGKFAQVVSDQSQIAPPPELTATPDVFIQTLETAADPNLPPAINDILRAKEEAFFRGVKMAEAFIEGGEQTLIEFDGQAITTGEYLEAKVRYVFELEDFRQIVNTVPPREEINSPLLFVPKDPETRQRYAAILEINELHSADSWVLNKLIAQRAVVSEARAQGLVVSREEISNRLSENRASVNNSMSDPWFFNKYLDENRGYISVVGLERFWSEILPERYERQLIFDLWYVEQLKKLGNDGPSKALHDVTQEAILHSEIKVHDLSTLSPDIVGIKEMLAVNNNLLDVAATYKQAKPVEK